MIEACSHLNQIRRVKPRTRGCEECLKIGDDWVHLRLCMICGRLLRFIEEQACDETFPRDYPPDHAVLRTWRDLGLVLRRRGYVGLLRSVNLTGHLLFNSVI
jgi:hypothetical protein